MMVPGLALAVIAAAGVFVAAVIDHYLQPHIPPLDSLDWGTQDS